MSRDEEDIDELGFEMPTPCENCECIFDLNDGRGCGICKIIHCRRCVKEDDLYGYICKRCAFNRRPRRAGRGKA